ncbi:MULTISPECIES: hypothetical protein [unclassified Brenneria]|uniref:hypothetical protein n=1 Tax=unclassified Brenneria TaxID=2634434 RepID=UPI0029C22866|nr:MULTISPECIES: hypothetical protein [unclassified Brenneria]MDX5628898.1 hypothetical protein [Brenneria sp. L3-3Z]MDX5696037.1 hypothetical protein [Brenneria sp. L4-2C]
MEPIFLQNEVGMVVRGKNSAEHTPGLLEQHADCILSNGAPIGFYGRGEGYSNSLGTVGLGMEGYVLTYNDFSSKAYGRPYYIDTYEARRYNLVSTVLLVSVSSAEAMLFDAAWNEIKNHPDTFNIVGNNCSTHASLAFVKAGILPSEISGLDTPDQLYRQIVAVKKGLTRSYSGYVGFTPDKDRYYVEVQ